MIQLDRHIEILLLSNDCVIVPRLGGFMAHHVCARYYADTQTFLPPTRQLGFNAQLQINDSLLAQSYIEAYDISYPEALRRIDDEVNELKQKIQNEGRCELNDIGVLRLNAEGNIEFDPCEAGILTPGLYGLNHLDITPLAELTAQKAEETVADETGQKSESVIPTPQPIPQLAAGKAAGQEISDEEDDDENEDDEKYIKIRISTIRHIATAAAVIAVLCICAIPFGKLTQPQTSKSYLDTNVLYNILPECLRVPAKTATPKIEAKAKEKTNTVAKPAPKTVAKAETKSVQEAKKAEETKKAEPAKQETKVEEQHFFSIVLASKVSKKNGEAYVEQLKKNGFDKGEVISRSNGSKVIYGHFKSETEAHNFLRNLRSSAKDFNEGWVMEFN